MKKSGYGNPELCNTYTMVKLRAGAERFVVNARLILLEGRIGGIDSNRNRANVGNSSLQSGFICWKENVSGIGSSNVCRIESTGSSDSGLIRIERSRIDSVVGLDVFENAGHAAAIASVVSVGAGTVDDILF